MAEKKKNRRVKKNDILMPHVAEDALIQPEEDELSAEALRAKDAVDEIYRKLFGGNAKKETASVAAPLPKVDEVQESVQEEEPAGEKKEEACHEQRQEISEPNEELPLPISVASVTDEVLPLKEELEASGEVFRLLLDMEYEKELGDAIGFERIRAYHERSINGKRSSRRRSAVSGEEYDRPDKDEESAITRRYRNAHSGWMVRLGLSVLLFVLMLLYERGTWMAALFGGPLDGAKYPVPYILIGMQLLVLDCAICYRPLWEGLRHVLRLSPVDYSVHVGVILITFLYHILLLCVPHTEYPTLLLSPAAFCLSLLAASELLNSYREALAFRVISARQQKYTVLPRVSVGSVQHSARARLRENEGKGDIWYLRPISFVCNYFANTKKHVSRHRNMGAHFLLVLGMGVTVGLFAFAGGATTARVMGLAMVATMLAVPVISAVLNSIPLFFSAVFCLKQKAAIIGEQPLESGFSGDTLVLPGNELFYSMEREHFRLLDLCDAHRVTVYLCALLEKLHSPLASSFAVDSASRLSTAEVALSHIGDEGVSAELARQGCCIALGTAEYMTRRGMSFNPVADSEERPLYVAVDDHVCAVFYVRYVLHADVEPLLRDMHRAGLKIAVRSKDPCVRTDVLARLLSGYAEDISVQKPTANELDLRLDRIDATVVALNSCKELARTVVVCHRVARVGVLGKLLQLICALGGTALAVTLAFFGVLLPGLLVTLWILFWCGGYALLSYFYLRRPTEDV